MATDDNPSHDSADAAWQVRVQLGPFDVSAEMDAMRGADLGIGGIGLFVGTVRDLAGGPTERRAGAVADAGSAIELELELEHYPGMTERSLLAMLQTARQRFGLRAGRIVHRVGRLGAGEPIVLVMAAAAHRHAALDGCAFLMDWLKTEAPFWKKEHGANGSRWVEAREADGAAMARWAQSTATDLPRAEPLRTATAREAGR